MVKELTIYRSKKDYARRCTDVYQTYLQRGMERASNRKEYASVVQTLKKRKQYPNGKAQELADMWKEKYRRRTSMLDELKKQDVNCKFKLDTRKTSECLLHRFA